MLDDMFEDEEQDEETEEILQSVFDDIGLDLAGQMKSVPATAPPRREPAQLEADSGDPELNKLIAQLL